MPTGRSPFIILRKYVDIVIKVQISGNRLGTNASTDTMKWTGAIQTPMQQSRDIKKFMKVSFNDLYTVLRATIFVARIKAAVKHPNT